MVTDLLGDPGQLTDRITAAARQLPDVLRGGDGTGLLELVQSPEQRQPWPRVTAVMSLLEGHADVVMDEVGPQVIPTVGDIRERFTAPPRGQRRGSTGCCAGCSGWTPRCASTATAPAFVRGVTAPVGTDGFNAVWTCPDTLPCAEEIADPAAWVRRVHG